VGGRIACASAKEERSVTDRDRAGAKWQAGRTCGGGLPIVGGQLSTSDVHRREWKVYDYGTEARQLRFEGVGERILFGLGTKYCRADWADQGGHGEAREQGCDSLTVVARWSHGRRGNCEVLVEKTAQIPRN